MPIVWHVIQLYAVQGFRRFLLATGYRRRADRALRRRAQEWPAGVRVECVDTGLETPTGGRIKLLEPRLAGEELFCATYADGLADIDLDALLGFHREHGALASMTVVRPQLQFGVTELDGDGRVTGFREKPTLRALDQRRLLLLRAGRARLPATPTACSSASRWSALAADGRAARASATRASGSAWTPTRTPSRSTTCGPIGQAPWRRSGGGRAPAAEPPHCRARYSATGSRIPRRRRSPA